MSNDFQQHLKRSFLLVEPRMCRTVLNEKFENRDNMLNT